MSATPFEALLKGLPPLDDPAPGRFACRSLLRSASCLAGLVVLRASGPRTAGVREDLTLGFASRAVHGSRHWANGSAESGRRPPPPGKRSGSDAVFTSRMVPVATTQERAKGLERSAPTGSPCRHRPVSDDE